MRNRRGEALMVGLFFFNRMTQIKRVFSSLELFEGQIIKRNAVIYLIVI